MDFVADQLANAMKFRTLMIVDVFSKEALEIEVVQRLRSEHGCRVKPVSDALGSSPISFC